MGLTFGDLSKVRDLSSEDFRTLLDLLIRLKRAFFGAFLIINKVLFKRAGISLLEDDLLHLVDVLWVNSMVGCVLGVRRQDLMNGSLSVMSDVGWSDIGLSVVDVDREGG